MPEMNTCASGHVVSAHRVQSPLMAGAAIGPPGMRAVLAPA